MFSIQPNGLTWYVPLNVLHYLKNVRIQSIYGPYFPVIYGHLHSKFPYSVKI